MSIPMLPFYMDDFRILSMNSESGTINICSSYTDDIEDVDTAIEIDPGCIDNMIIALKIMKVIVEADLKVDRIAKYIGGGGEERLTLGYITEVQPDLTVRFIVLYQDTEKGPAAWEVGSDHLVHIEFLEDWIPIIPQDNDDDEDLEIDDGDDEDEE